MAEPAVLLTTVAVEEQLLLRISRRVGVPEFEFRILEKMIAAQARFREQAAYGTGGKRGGHRPQPAGPSLEDAYAALGVTPASSASEIKRAYRKLISQNHPDKLAARGLPESMRAVAEERSREINSAYDLIKAARSDLK